MALQVPGKTALVTGGGSGICFEFTKLLISNGCNVLVADLNLTPEAEEFINGTKGAKVRAIFKKTDVTNWTELQAAFDGVMTEFGGLDIVCPGAGVFEPHWSGFWRPKTGVDSIESSSYKTLEINVTHPIRATQLAIDYFKRQNQGHGSVVLISSIAAQGAYFLWPMYAASKAAISSFARSLAPLEQSLKIRVNAVAPGIVKTPLWTADKLDIVNEELDSWVTTTQIAEVMLDLVQKEEYVGGTVLEVGTESVRKVEILNDPGPIGKGFGASAPNGQIEDTFKAIEAQFGK